MLLSGAGVRRTDAESFILWREPGRIPVPEWDARGRGARYEVLQDWGNCEVV